MAFTISPNNINIDTLRNLDVDKQYYLSKSGEVKEASAWMRLKCWVGVASARQKVSNLIDTVRATLLNSASMTSDATLDADIKKDVIMTEMVKGSVIKDLANRFASANEQKIASKHAENLVAKQADKLTTRLSLDHFNPNMDRGALFKIVKHALMAVCSNPLPMTNGANGTTELNREAFLENLDDFADNVEKQIGDLLNTETLHGKEIDNRYADHIINTLYNANGTRNETPVTSLKTPIAIKTAHAFQLNEKVLGSRAAGVYDRLVNRDHINPEDKIKQLLGFCDHDKELEEYVLDIAPDLCMNSNEFLRTDETIKNKIAAIKENLAEINDIQDEFPGSAEMIKNALKLLGSGSMPKGFIKELAALAKNAKLDSLKSLNGMSSAEQIYKGIEDIRVLLSTMNKTLDLDEIFEKAGNLEAGGPEAMASHGALVALALSKAGPALMARLPNIVKSAEFGKASVILDNLVMDAHNNALNTLEKNSQANAHAITYLDDRILSMLPDNAEIISGQKVEPGVHEEPIDFATDISTMEIIDILDNAKI